MRKKSIYRQAMQESTSGHQSTNQYISTPKSKSFISQIVYPKPLLDCEESCFLVGWNTEQFECTIAGLIPISSIDVDLYKSYSMLTEAVRLAFENPRFSMSRHSTFNYPPSSSNSARKSPIILGLFQYPSSSSINQEYSINDEGGGISFPIQDLQNNGIWITLSKELHDNAPHTNLNLISSPILSSARTPSKHKIKLQSIYSLGYRYDTACYLIEYTPLPCQHFYHVITSSYCRDHLLFPTYFVTTSNSDILQSINIECKVGEDDPLPVVTSSEKKRSDHSSNTPKKTLLSQQQRSARSTGTPANQPENIRIILSQINASEDLMYWICFHLQEVAGKPFLSIHNSSLKSKMVRRRSRTIFNNYQNRLMFVEENQYFLTFYNKIISFFSYFVLIWFKFLLVLEIFLRFEIPFIRSIIYFCDWKEIAPAQVTMLQETQREENITKGTARSELRERRRTRRKSREKQEASLRKKEEDEVHDKKGRSNFTTFILSIRNCFSFLLVERKNIEIVDSAYSLYRFSFFFHEIIQTIEQYYSLLDLFSQLFPTVISNQGHSPPKEPINLDSRKSLFQRKYYYLQILHHLLFLCLNALLGYIVSYLLSQVDQAFLTTSIVSTLHYWHNFLINENLRWIQSSPIGIKLNSYIVDKTNQVITVLIENYIQFFLSIYYYPYCKLFLQFFFLYFPFSGITYQLSLLLDMVMMVTFPINVLYFLITHLAQLHYHLLSSLWLFFNGQKWNILRQRIDTYAYTPLPSSYSAPQSSTSVPSSSATSSNSGASQRSLPSSFAPFSSNEMYHSYYYSNQLLFGVLLFSIMFFLIPTVMIYYWFFVLLRVLVTSFYIAGWNSIMILKKFPCIYYCFYFFDYFFFTNRWHLEVDIPCSSFSASSFSSSPQRTVYPTDEKTVEVHRRKKSKITTAANVPLSKQPTRKDMMEQHSECSQPSEVSTDSEVNEKKGSQTMPPSKSLTPLKIDDNFTTDPASYLPDYPSPSHSHIHGNHRARNRKSLMMSLTEKYRKEEEEEQQQQRISLTQEINIPAIISAPVSSMGEESPSEDHGEIEARPKDSEVVGSFPLSLQPIKEPHSHEDDPFALNSSIYNDLQLSFSELSDEKTPREHAFSDQWDDSPAGDETSGNSIFKNGSPVPQSAILPSAIQSISMRFLPVNYDIIDLVIATFELFFTSPYTFSNHATDFDCYKNFTTRQRIFRFAQTISFSKPLYLIFEKNALRFTIFNPKEWNSIQTRSTSGYGDSIIVRKEAISSLRSLLSESDERRSLPFDDYYRKKVLSIICLIYSLYLLAFVWGVGSLLWNQMTWLYEIEASSLSASSNFEQIHAIKLNSMQNQTVGRALQEEIDLFSFSSLFYFFIGKK